MIQLNHISKGDMAELVDATDLKGQFQYILSLNREIY